MWLLMCAAPALAWEAEEHVRLTEEALDDLGASVFLDLGSGWKLTDLNEALRPDGDRRATYELTSVASLSAAPAIEVGAHRARLHSCVRRGFAEVVRTFGEMSGGGYGAWHVPLDPAYRNAPAVGPDCLDNWVTNAAMHAAWSGGELSPEALGRLVVIPPAGAVPDLGARTQARIDAVRVSWRIHRRAAAAPDETDLARGGLGTLAGASQDTLGLADQTGPALGDDAEMSGLFNRAHANHWCAAASR